jgi:hypothetical protein
MKYDGISFGRDKPKPTPPFDPMLIANKHCIAEGCNGYVARFLGPRVLYCSKQCQQREAKRRQRANKKVEA